MHHVNRWPFICKKIKYVDPPEPGTTSKSWAHALEFRSSAWDRMSTWQRCYRELGCKQWMLRLVLFAWMRCWQRELERRLSSPPLPVPSMCLHWIANITFLRILGPDVAHCPKIWALYAVWELVLWITGYDALRASWGSALDIQYTHMCWQTIMPIQFGLLWTCTGSVFRWTSNRVGVITIKLIASASC